MDIGQTLLSGRESLTQLKRFKANAANDRNVATQRSRLTIMNEELDKPLSQATKSEWEQLAEELPDGDLHLGAVNVMSRFARLEKYVDIVEAQMEEVQRIEQMTLGGTGDSEEDETQWRNHFYEFDDHYVPTLRYSLLVMVHMLIERGLGECCEWLKHAHGSKISYKDLKGSPVEQCAKFIERMTGVQPGKMDEWARIGCGQKVRNCVVHTLGEIEDLAPDKKRDIAKICRSEPGLSIDNYARLQIDFIYAKNQIQHAKKFFEELFKRLGFHWQPSMS